MYSVGLDLGQSQDYTAIAVAERRNIPVPQGSRPHHVYAIPHLERFPLGTSYPAIVERVAEVLAMRELQGARLAVDSTGVGAAVVDLLWKVGLYGLINLMIIVMLVVFEPIAIAFVQIATAGSTPELESTIATTMTRSAVVIWATYGTIALVALIGTAKIW